VLDLRGAESEVQGVSQFVEFTELSDEVLKCPRCGDEYLHQSDIEIFNRGEDKTTGLHLIVLADSLQMDPDVVDGNPSGRRQGMRILFSCEHCEGVAWEKGESAPQMWLTISQHKGNTYVQWES
jgi:hypothetical protein